MPSWDDALDETLEITADFVLPDFISLAGGSFIMGSAEGRADERPLHDVRLRPFVLARLPVTNREYAAFVADGAQPPASWHDPRYNRPHQPVVAVTWGQAVGYCAWLSQKSERGCRLPTEAEWEYAARGGVETQPRYPWGDHIPELVPGVSLADAPLDRPAPVGLGPTNPYGIRDLGWNVHEWCSDWYDAGYYAVSPRENPQGAASGTRRSSRGGAWRHRIRISRTAARSAIPPDFVYTDYGFRVAATLAE